MRTAEIRQRFIDHFVSRGHAHVPSASLIADDPNLLLVPAGMVPFKPYFLGEQPAPWPRATSVQKCVRTLDIEEVGKTTRHGTFFQMNGNFSFGDYFKEGAIELAWDLVTRPQADGGYGFNEADLVVSVYYDDDEAIGIWKRVAGLPDDRIVRLGMKDNFWSMGVPGPCGPCSEIMIDRGPEFGPEGDVEKAGDRYLELWNLVFMQYVRGAGPAKEDYPILGELPAKNIDTGMGLERVAFVMQGVGNMYEIDEVFPVIQRASELSGRRYGAEDSDDVRFRVVADHVRSALMIIGDGIVPSNEGRGYVLRRLLRRVVRSMRLLGVDVPTLPELLPVSRDAMAASYPEVASDFSRISQIAYAEEESFRGTLRSGTILLDTAVREANTRGAAQLSGDQAFTLHDTYGFPIDLTIEMAGEQGLQVDEVEFRRLMDEQRHRAKQDALAKKTGHVDASAYRELFNDAGTSVFTGYMEISGDASIRGLLADTGLVSAAREGDVVELVVDRTPFYGEAGGQQGDTGLIVTDSAELEVLDTQRPFPDMVVHRVRVARGEVAVGQVAHLVVDTSRRRAISRAHTATHLVHTAFRRALGDQATQAGSLNAPGRLRFDFHSPGAVPPSVLGDVEAEVNSVLIDDHEVRAFVTTQEEARRIGAIALFGEKYGEAVRVVEVGDYARELCGGTHAARSGQIGVVKLLHESSIGAGVRRVEGLVGLDAFSFLAREHVLVAQLSELLKVQPDDLPERIAAMTSRLREVEKELERVRAGAVLEAGGGLADAAVDIGGVAVVATEVPPGTSADDARKLANDVRGRLEPQRPAVVVIATRSDGKAQLVVTCGPSAQARGLKAGALVRELAAVLGGGGGGKDDIAQAGGSKPEAVPEVLALVPALVARTAQ